MPNITGELVLGATACILYKNTLAFNSTMITGTLKPSVTSGAGDIYIKFNANDGATTQGIYRDDCTTVQPPALTTIYVIKH